MVYAVKYFHYGDCIRNREIKLLNYLYNIYNVRVYYRLLGRRQIIIFKSDNEFLNINNVTHKRAISKELTRLMSLKLYGS